MKSSHLRTAVIGNMGGSQTRQTRRLANKTGSSAAHLDDVLRFIFALVLALTIPTLAFASDDDGYDAHTIRAADLPLHPPRFDQYPALATFNGSVAPADVRSSPQVRLFRTRIREGAKQGPNFAGHYTIVFWGCGTGCVSLAIVDARTGKVFFPSNLGSIDNVNVAYEELESSDGRLIQLLP